MLPDVVGEAEGNISLSEKYKTLAHEQFHPHLAPGKIDIKSGPTPTPSLAPPFTSFNGIVFVHLLIPDRLNIKYIEEQPSRPNM